MIEGIVILLNWISELTLPLVLQMPMVIQDHKQNLVLLHLM